MIPTPAALDLGEVGGPQQQRGRVQAAEAGAGLLVRQPVVLDGGFPAHPTEQAEDLHPLIMACGPGVEATGQQAGCGAPLRS